MKRYAFLIAVTFGGFCGTNARGALPVGYCQVNVKLTALIQGSNVVRQAGTRYNVTRMKIITKDVLNLIGEEYNMSFTNAQLAVDSFGSGNFSVLDRTGHVLLANAGQPAGEDDYRLATGVNNFTYTGTETPFGSAYNDSVIGSFSYSDAGETNYFGIYGLMTIKDVSKLSGSTESFKLVGADNGNFNGKDMVVSGTITGSGKTQ